MKCTPEIWVMAATVEAQRSNVMLSHLLGGVQTPSITPARWRAWRGLVCEGYSYYSIGQSSGFDHTSIRYGCVEQIRVERQERYKRNYVSRKNMHRHNSVNGQNPESLCGERI